MLQDHQLNLLLYLNKAGELKYFVNKGGYTNTINLN